MANYQAIMRLRPEVRDFIRHRRWVHRGDVIAYGPKIACDSFSTDGAGFRHSTLGAETLDPRHRSAVPIARHPDRLGRRYDLFREAGAERNRAAIRARGAVQPGASATI